MTNTFDDMFQYLDAWLNQSNKSTRTLENYGLKSTIKRPHNLYAIRDENGNITSYKIEVVTTPFSKKDVRVEVEDDILTVICGSENHHDEDSEHMLYKGISSQSYQFSLRLNKIDVENITAKVDDGILRITMPVLVEKKTKAISISVE